MFLSRDYGLFIAHGNLIIFNKYKLEKRSFEGFYVKTSNFQEKLSDRWTDFVHHQVSSKQKSLRLTLSRDSVSP